MVQRNIFYYLDRIKAYSLAEKNVASKILNKRFMHIVVDRKLAFRASFGIDQLSYKCQSICFIYVTNRIAAFSFFIAYHNF